MVSFRLQLVLDGFLGSKPGLRAYVQDGGWRATAKSIAGSRSSGQPVASQVLCRGIGSLEDGDVVSSASQENCWSKTKRVQRGSRRRRLVRTRSWVPLLQSLPSTRATPTRTAFGTPPSPIVIMAAECWLSRKAVSAGVRGMVAVCPPLPSGAAGFGIQHCPYSVP